MSIEAEKQLDPPSSPGLAVPSMKAIAAEPARRQTTPGRQLSRNERKEERRRGEKQTGLALPELNLGSFNSSATVSTTVQHAVSIEDKVQTTISKDHQMLQSIASMLESHTASRQLPVSQDGQTLFQDVRAQEVTPTAKEGPTSPKRKSDAMPTVSQRPAKRARHNDANDTALEKHHVEDGHLGAENLAVDHSPAEEARKAAGSAGMHKSDSAIAEIDPHDQALFTRQHGVSEKEDGPFVTIPDMNRALLEPANTADPDLASGTRAIASKGRILDDEATFSAVTHDQTHPPSAQRRKKKPETSKTAKSGEKWNARKDSTQRLRDAARAAVEEQLALGQDSKNHQIIRDALDAFSAACDKDNFALTCESNKPKKQKGNKTDARLAQLRKRARELQTSRDAIQKELRNEEKAWQVSRLRRKQMCHLHTYAVSLNSASLQDEGITAFDGLLAVSKSLTNRMRYDSSAKDAMLSKLKSFNDLLEEF